MSFIKYLKERLDEVSLKQLEDEGIRLANKYIKMNQKHPEALRAIEEIESFVKIAEDRLKNLDGTETKEEISNLQWVLHILKDNRLPLIKGEPEALDQEKEREADIQHWVKNSPSRKTSTGYSPWN